MSVYSERTYWVRCDMLGCKAESGDPYNGSPTAEAAIRYVTGEERGNSWLDGGPRWTRDGLRVYCQEHSDVPW
jgi:hypothetical protein